MKQPRFEPITSAACSGRPSCLQARDDFAQGQIDADELRGIEDEAIRAAVRMQEDVGLRSATDGEFRRTSWHMDFIYQLDGIGTADDKVKVQFHNEEGDLEFMAAALHVNGTVGLSRTIFGDAFEFLQQTVSTATPKLTIPSPSMIHYRGGRAAIDESVYPDIGQFWDDVVAAYREQVRRLGDARLHVPPVRRHEPCLPERPRAAPLRRLDRRRPRPPAPRVHPPHQRGARRSAQQGMRITTHMCRGNFRSSWVAEGGYDFVAEALFNELDVDGYFMEWDDERSGGFEPLRLLPKGEKRVVLGLVTTKRGELESKDELKRRIEEASRFAPLEQLCLSPQCGFSSTVEGNALTYDEEVAKLRLVVEVAEEIWS